MLKFSRCNSVNIFASRLHTSLRSPVDGTQALDGHEGAGEDEGATEPLEES